MAALIDLLFDEPGAVRCLVGADGTVRRASPGFEAWTGHSAADAVGRTLAALLGEAHPAARAVAEGAAKVPRHRAARGSWWEGRVDPVGDEPLSLITVHELGGSSRVSLAQQRQLALDAAQLGWWHYDPLTRIATYDERYKQIFGVAGHEKPNEEILKLLHPEDLPRVWAAVERALDPAIREQFGIEYRVLRGDEVRWVEAHGLALFEGEPPNVRATDFVGTVADVTARRHDEETLRDRTALLRAISDSSGDAIIAKDLQGRFRFANPLVLRIFGKPLEEVLGRTNADFAPAAAAAPVVMENDRRIMQTGVTEELEERGPRADGSMGVWLSRKTPWRDAAGRVIGLLAISHDITDRKRAEDALRESDAHKSEFLAILSHELRNPLAAIRNSVHVLESATVGAATKTHATAVIRRQSEHLSRLVDDLLDLSRISRGKVELRRAHVDLRALVSAAVEDFAAVFDQRSVAVRLEQPAEPLWVDVDATRVSQTLGNLLHNAATFTPPGGVVSVRSAIAEGMVEVVVTDSGVGIEAEQIARVFEPFAQAQQTLARTTGGLGLGLALARSFMELHGGTVDARSGGLGRGAEFVIRVPSSPPPAPAAAQPAPAHGPRAVLVIEDNPDAADSLAEALASQGHDVRVARDGRAGLALAREWMPDAILCDIGLPDMDGYAVARALRESPKTRPIRLIALSGYARADDVARAKAAGFDLHLAKPPGMDVVDRALRQ